MEYRRDQRSIIVHQLELRVNIIILSCFADAHAVKLAIKHVVHIVYNITHKFLSYPWTLMRL